MKIYFNKKWLKEMTLHNNKNTMSNNKYSTVQNLAKDLMIIDPENKFIYINVILYGTIDHFDDIKFLHGDELSKIYAQLNIDVERAEMCKNQFRNRKNTAYLKKYPKYCKEYIQTFEKWLMVDNGINYIKFCMLMKTLDIKPDENYGEMILEEIEEEI